MKRSCLILFLLLGFFLDNSGKVIVDEKDGAVTSIRLDGDETGMNWIMDCDGSQYPWVTEQYRWGKVDFKVAGPPRINKDCTPVQGADSKLVRVSVIRKCKGDDVIETYTFRNEGKEDIVLKDVDIYIPFNDNYPDAKTCVNNRCNAHIWDGGSCAYVFALRMGGKGPHLGLMLTKGYVDGYSVSERDSKKGMSNFRGVLSLNVADTLIRAGQTMEVQWRLFEHNGWDDFKKQILKKGGTLVSSDQYVYQTGEKAEFKVQSEGKIFGMLKNQKQGAAIVKEGDNRIHIRGKNLHTWIDVLGIPEPEDLIRRRIEFVMKNQQVLDENNPEYGAYVEYDNETHRQAVDYNRSDCTPGRERLGYAILMCQEYIKNAGKSDSDKEYCKKILHSLDIYRHNFFLNIQDSLTGRVYDSAKKTGKDRCYNYAWYTNVCLHLYKIYRDKAYLRQAYRTMKYAYTKWGDRFYMIDIPVIGYEMMQKAGLVKEAEDYRKMMIAYADQYAANGLNYPKSEVNYEQSIVAPSVVHLLQIYKLTGEEKYLSAAEGQIPALLAFEGEQPSYHLNNIAIRHWDGYWFGKRRIWGDTMCHYWSCISAYAYELLYDIQNKDIYRKRAENIVQNNLSLFFADGSASCAYIYPKKVNGRPAHFADPLSNDEAYALVFYNYIMNSRHYWI